MKRVVSVSLGSSTGDYVFTTNLFGKKVCVERIGTDGNTNRFIRILESERSSVDCFGFGGADMYTYVDGKKYIWHHPCRIAKHAGDTPIVDGSGLKGTMERRTVQQLQQQSRVDFSYAKTLVLSAIDRYGLAEEVSSYGNDVIFGDIIFGLGVPIPIKNLKTLEYVAMLILPILTRLPQNLFYPTGKKQESHNRKISHYFNWAQVICGDYHMMRPYIGSNIRGKTIITNTIKSLDIKELQEKGLNTLITTTPKISIDGRSPGTNVLEAIIVALSEIKPEDLHPEVYYDFLDRIEWYPRIDKLNY